MERVDRLFTRIVDAGALYLLQVRIILDNTQETTGLQFSDPTFAPNA